MGHFKGEREVIISASAHNYRVGCENCTSYWAPNLKKKLVFGVPIKRNKCLATLNILRQNLRAQTSSLFAVVVSRDKEQNGFHSHTTYNVCRHKVQGLGFKVS